MEEKNENLSHPEFSGPLDPVLWPGQRTFSRSSREEPGSWSPPECCLFGCPGLILLWTMRHTCRQGGFVQASPF